MLEKLKTLEARYRELEMQLASPDAAANPVVFAKLMREHKAQTPIIEAYRAYCAAEAEMEEAHVLMAGEDTEIRELAEVEFYACRDRCDELTEQLKFCFCPVTRTTAKM